MLQPGETYHRGRSDGNRMIVIAIEFSSETGKFTADCLNAHLDGKKQNC